MTKYGRRFLATKAPAIIIWQAKTSQNRLLQYPFSFLVWILDYFRATRNSFSTGQQVTKGTEAFFYL